MGELDGAGLNTRGHHFNATLILAQLDLGVSAQTNSVRWIYHFDALGQELRSAMLVQPLVLRAW